MGKNRSVLIAVLLGLLVPSLGHLYAARFQVAIHRLLLAVGGGIISLALLVWYPFGPASFVIAVVVMSGTYIGIAIDGGRWARRAPRPFAPSAHHRWYVYLAFTFGLVLFAKGFRALFVRFVAEAYHVTSGAMAPTLLVGDVLYIRRNRGHDEEGLRRALVVYELPDERGVQGIKRIVGLPGDTLAMQEGVLYRNGLRIDEPYVLSPAEDSSSVESMRTWQLPLFVGEDAASYIPTLNDWGPLHIPAGSVFVLGDNRDASYDTRYHGLVAVTDLRGSPMHIYFSYDVDSPRLLPFLTGVRWARMGRIPT